MKLVREDSGEPGKKELIDSGVWMKHDDSDLPVILGTVPSCFLQLIRTEDLRRTIPFCNLPSFVA